MRLLIWGALLGTTHEEIRELRGGQARRVGRLRRSGWGHRGQGPAWLSAAEGPHGPVNPRGGAREALRPQRAPQMGRIATAGVPLLVEHGSIRIQTTRLARAALTLREGPRGKPTAQRAWAHAHLPGNPPHAT